MADGLKEPTPIPIDSSGNSTSVPWYMRGLGAVAEGGNSALFGLPENAEALLESLVRGTKFSDERAKNKATMEMVRHDILGPSGTITADLVGGFASPVNKLKAVKALYEMPGLTSLLSSPAQAATGILARGALGAGEGATTAALEGGDPGEAALNAAKYGAAFEGVGGPAFKMLGAIGAKTRDAASGITGKVYKEFLQAFGDQGPARLKQAMEDVQSNGAGDYSALMKPTSKFSKVAETASKNVAAQKAFEANRIIDTADQIFGPGQQPNMSIAQKLADKNTALNSGGVLDRVQQNLEAWKQKYPNQTLADLQAEKAAQNIDFVADPYSRSGDDIWRKVAKKTIEDAADTITTPGTLADLNRQRQAQIILQDAFEAQRPGALANNPLNTFRQAQSTTGALGPAGIAAAGAIGGKKTALLDLALNTAGYFKPAGRVMGQAMQDISEGAQTPGPRNAIATLLAEPESKDEKKPLSIGQPPADDFDKYFGAKQEKPTADDFDKYFSGDSKVNVPEKLRNSIIKFESAGKADAVSPKGAQGLMQIEPATWNEWAPKVAKDDPSIDVNNPFDPDSNKKVGTAYIGMLLDKYKGDEPTALAAYNWGLGHIDKLHQSLDSTDFKDVQPLLPSETQQYVKNIMDDYTRQS